MPTREYYLANKDTIDHQMRMWHKTHPRKQYCQDNREHIDEMRRLWVAEHPEEAKALNARCYRRDADIRTFFGLKEREWRHISAEARARMRKIYWHFHDEDRD